MKKEVIGNCTLYNGDCLEILPTLDKNSAEIAVTSPPYNLCKTYSNSEASNTSRYMKKKYEEWYDDELPEWQYQGQQQTVIHELIRICKSSVFYNHKIRYAWHSQNVYRTPTNMLHPLDWLDKFPIWCEIIWDRCGIGNPSRRYHISDERIYQIGKPIKWYVLGLNNIWRIPPSKNVGHVCTFPEKLVENCILPTTDKNDVVIDPYMGAGTTGIVCARHDRKFIGIEKDEKYFDIACKRIENSMGMRKFYK